AAGAACAPAVGGLLLSGCATPSSSSGVAAARLSAGSRADVYRCVNRLSWGATEKSVDRAMRMGYEHYVDEQLRGQAGNRLPDAVQAQI
ncbi:hypothetical protein ABTN16_19385, partial [Acinetobacter baumannii]